jgi:hypothetical protein
MKTNPTSTASVADHPRFRIGAGVKAFAGSSEEVLIVLVCEVGRFIGLDTNLEVQKECHAFLVSRSRSRLHTSNIVSHFHR